MNELDAAWDAVLDALPLGWAVQHASWHIGQPLARLGEHDREIFLAARSRDLWKPTEVVGRRFSPDNRPRASA